ncbi:MAG TPA: glycosyltransferase [Thermoplasmata archaeon]|nr:glycosyltransferase [Thermoplasmata archaeon]
MTLALSPDARPTLVIVPLPPSYRGGTEEYAYRVALRVHRERPVRIATTSVRWGQDPHPLPTGDIPVEVLPAREVFQRPVMSRAGMVRLRREVEAARLVHLHMPFPWVERKVVAWARARGVPVVLTYHMDADFGAASRNPVAGLITASYRRLSAFPALRGARAVISNSGGYARASPVLSRFLPIVRVIAKGVDIERLHLDPSATTAPPRPAADPQLFPRCGPETRRVAFVGRLVPYKGLPVLIDAVGILAREGVDVKLFIAGRGPMLEELRRQAAGHGLGDRVEFLGFVPDERLAALYTGADVVACPSISLLESTATCLEEAAACGIPVLGSALPGTEETVPSDGVHGILAPPRDVQGVATGLRTLLARPRPTDRLPYRTWEDTARQYLELFRELS